MGRSIANLESNIPKYKKLIETELPGALESSISGFSLILYMHIYILIYQVGEKMENLHCPILN